MAETPEVPIQFGRSDLTGIEFLSRKWTVNENLPDEARCCEFYYGVHPSGSVRETVSESLALIAKSNQPGEPMSLKVRSFGEKGFVAEGPQQAAELILMLVDAASYAEGMDPREYVASLFDRTAAKV